MGVATILCILIIRNRKDVMKQSKNRMKDRKIKRNSYMTYIFLFYFLCLYTFMMLVY